MTQPTPINNKKHYRHPAITCVALELSELLAGTKPTIPVDEGKEIVNEDMFNAKESTWGIFEEE